MTVSRYESRKFILCVLVVLLATALLALGRIPGAEPLLTGAQWVTVVSGSFAFYAASNVAQKVWAPGTPEAGL